MLLLRPRWGARMGPTTMVDTMVNDGLTDAYNNYHMGITAENICEPVGHHPREELDAFALSSQDKCAKGSGLRALQRRNYSRPRKGQKGNG